MQEVSGGDFFQWLTLIASASYDLETLDAISSPQETSDRLCGSDVMRLPAC